jgi:hypothetical protein
VINTQDSSYLSLKVMADADHEVSTMLIRFEFFFLQY